MFQLDSERVARGASSRAVVVTATVLALIAWFRSSPGFFLHGNSYVSDWIYTHYLFDYADGFVKRGLVGQVFSWVLDKTTYKAVTYFSYAVFTLLAVLLCCLFSSHWANNRERAGAFLFALLAITSPATIQHFAIDVGRFDIAIYCIAIAALVLIHKLSMRSEFFLPILLTLLLLVATFIHEAAFVIVAPMVFLFWFHGSPALKRLPIKLASFAVVLVVTYLVSTHGSYTHLPLDLHLDRLRSEYGGRVHENSLAVIHNTSLQENITLSLTEGFTWKKMDDYAAFIFFMAPFFYLLYRFAKSNKPYFDLKTALLLASCFSPLVLYPLGIDHFRWWALSLTNLFIITSFLMLSEKAFLESVFKFIEEHKRLVIGISVFGLLTGPIGITSML
jgi:hypothetical protein